MAPLLWCGVIGFWSNTAETPVVSVAITPGGGTFAGWDAEDSSGAGTWRPDNCKWWNGTYYYDPGVCNAFSITRVSSSDIAQAVERANYCVQQTGGEGDCVLNGEIGFAVPSAFLYDHESAEMRMLIAPRYMDQGEPGPIKTIKMQDPQKEGRDLHPNQLFEFNTTVKIEYLKGGARTMVTEDLKGQDAYCIQALRRSIAPVCWEALD